MGDKLTQDQDLANLVGGRRGRIIPRVETGTPAETTGKLDEELVRTIVIKTAESVTEIVVEELVGIVEDWRDAILGSLASTDRARFEDQVADLIEQLEGEKNE